MQVPADSTLLSPDAALTGCGSYRMRVRDWFSAKARFALSVDLGEALAWLQCH